jgi:hypothetical protein
MPLYRVGASAFASVATAKADSQSGEDKEQD